jgi:hypothetical protein
MMLEVWIESGQRIALPVEIVAKGASRNGARP